MQRNNNTGIAMLNETGVSSIQLDYLHCPQTHDSVLLLSMSIMLMMVLSGVPVNIHTLYTLLQQQQSDEQSSWTHQCSVCIIALATCLVLAPIRIIDLATRMTGAETLTKVNSYLTHGYSALYPFFSSTALFTISQRALIHTSLCSQWTSSASAQRILQFVPWFFGVVYTGVLSAVRYSLPPHGPLTDSMVYCGQDMLKQGQLDMSAWALESSTELAMIVVSLLLQIIPYYEQVKAEYNRQTTVGVVYHHQNSRANTNTETVNRTAEALTARVSNTESLGPVNVRVSVSNASVHRASQASAVNTTGETIARNSLDSHRANCSSSSCTGSTNSNMVQQDLVAKVRARLGSDISERWDEDVGANALPGMIGDDDDDDEPDGQPARRVSTISSTASVNAPVNKKKSSGGSVDQARRSQPSMSQQQQPPHPQMQIYTISEDILQPVVDGHASGGGHSPAPPAYINRSGSISNHSGDSLGVPVSGSRSSSVYSSSHDTSRSQSRFLSVDSAESSSVRGKRRSFISRSSYTGSSRSMSRSSSSEGTLPPLKHLRRAPSNSYIAPVCTADAATSTLDLEQALAHCAQSQILDPKALILPADKGVLQEAWGYTVGSRVQHKLGSDHPFFRENQHSPTANEKISQWKISSSSGFGISDSDNQIDENMFTDLCEASGANARRSTATSITSFENIRSVSQQHNPVAPQINVIRPSDSTNPTLIHTSRRNRRKHAMLFQAQNIQNDDLQEVLSSAASNNNTNTNTDSAEDKTNSRCDVACQAELEESDYMSYEDNSNMVNIEIAMQGASNLDIQSFLKVVFSLILVYILLVAAGSLAISIVVNEDPGKNARGLVITRSLSYLWFVVIGHLLI